jgi:hypothetical protein
MQYQLLQTVLFSYAYENYNSFIQIGLEKWIFAKANSLFNIVSIEQAKHSAIDIVITIILNHLLQAKNCFILVNYLFCRMYNNITE